MKARNRLKKTDKSGDPFDLRPCDAGDFSCLMEMYETFTPRPASQGLPPQDPETCEQWARGLLETGLNVLAWRDKRVIGHAALVPDPNGKSGEFVIFVNQNFRNLGVGTELTGHILARARELGFNSVWLTVANTNFVAMKLYNKMGFKPCDMDACERTMMIKV
jgi:GNAT superfamily N-acetyltransferase